MIETLILYNKSKKLSSAKSRAGQIFFDKLPQNVPVADIGTDRRYEYF